MLKYFSIIIMLLASVVVKAESFPTLNSGRASCESLWVERNQLLNVAGYCFKTTLGQAVFDNQDCVPGQPALADVALNQIASIQQAEEARRCVVNTSQSDIDVSGRYGQISFGDGVVTLGPWPQALQTLDVFPRPSDRVRNCEVMEISNAGDRFLALRSGPDTRYPQVGQLFNGDRVFSKSVCMGRWCFSDSVLLGNQQERLNGWFHVRWCQ